MYVPPVATAGKPWPLLVFLHGSGERGCGRGRDLEKVRIHGPWRSEGVDQFLLLAPQCPAGCVWPGYANEVCQLVREACARLPVDRRRVYVTGLSLGAFGAWACLSADPRLFAAAVPICGGFAKPMDPGTSMKLLLPRAKERPAAADLDRVRDIPVWMFHGRQDRSVDVRGSELPYAGLGGSARGQHQLRLSVYEELGHSSWARAYATPGLLAWLLEHQSPQPEIPLAEHLLEQPGSEHRGAELGEGLWVLGRLKSGRRGRVDEAAPAPRRAVGAALRDALQKLLADTADATSVGERNFGLHAGALHSRKEELDVLVQEDLQRQAKEENQEKRVKKRKKEKPEKKMEKKRKKAKEDGDDDDDHGDEAEAEAEAEEEVEDKGRAEAHAARALQALPQPVLDGLLRLVGVADVAALASAVARAETSLTGQAPDPAAASSPAAEQAPERELERRHDVYLFPVGARLRFATSCKCRNCPGEWRAQDHNKMRGKICTGHATRRGPRRAE